MVYQIDNRFQRVEDDRSAGRLSINLGMKKPDHIHIFNFKIDDKSLRNQGIGKEFLKEVIGELLEKPELLDITLDAEPSEESGNIPLGKLKEFYESLGFTVESTRRWCSSDVPYCYGMQLDFANYR